MFNFYKPSPSVFSDIGVVGDGLGLHQTNITIII